MGFIAMGGQGTDTPTGVGTHAVDTRTHQVGTRTCGSDRRPRGRPATRRARWLVGLRLTRPVGPDTTVYYVIDARQPGAARAEALRRASAEREQLAGELADWCGVRRFVQSPLGEITLADGCQLTVT